jgi:DNA-directed RNA polymerase sigma subunit (sigma70/sigma32)
VEIEKSSWKVDFIDTMNQLTASEKRALAIRYGLVDGIQRTLDKTAVLMCMSNESARV